MISFLKATIRTLQAAVDFIETYEQYRRHHGIIYSLRIAYGIYVKGLPF